MRKKEESQKGQISHFPWEHVRGTSRFVEGYVFVTNFVVSPTYKDWVTSIWQTSLPRRPEVLSSPHQILTLLNKFPGY